MRHQQRLYTLFTQRSAGIRYIEIGIPEDDVDAVPICKRQAVFVCLQNGVRAVLNQLKHLPIAITARQHRLLDTIVLSNVGLEFRVCLKPPCSELVNQFAAGLQ